MSSFKSIEYNGGELLLLDQRLLPAEITIFKCRDYKQVEFAIRDMVVRGAPAIGVAGAYGIVMAAKEYMDLSRDVFLEKLEEARRLIGKSRPTAVNLMWAVKRMEKVIHENREQSSGDIYKALLREAEAIFSEDLETNLSMARWGNQIIPQGAVILTHCNTGALATVGYGTALGVIREAHRSGKNIQVYADETRPRFQGARLTAWELVQEGIDATLIPDSAAAVLIRDKKIDVILVGADRIALNGDTANKIGTFMVSQMAKDFGVPFYVVAPLSTVDFDTESGEDIVIEERDAKEVTHVGNVRVAPESIKVFNPAFDVTPNENITGIITEKGIVSPPFREHLLKLR